MQSQTTRSIEITAIWFWLPLALTRNRIKESLTVYGAIRSIKEQAIVLLKIQHQWAKLVNRWVSKFKGKLKIQKKYPTTLKICFVLSYWPKPHHIFMTPGIYTEPEASYCQECTWTMHGLAINYIATLLWSVSSQPDICYLFLKM